MPMAFAGVINSYDFVRFAQFVIFFIFLAIVTCFMCIHTCMCVFMYVLYVCTMYAEILVLFVDQLGSNNCYHTLLDCLR